MLNNNEVLTEETTLQMLEDSSNLSNISSDGIQLDSYCDYVASFPVNF